VEEDRILKTQGKKFQSGICIIFLKTGRVITVAYFLSLLPMVMLRADHHAHGNLSSELSQN
jgi:hypothetical protein